jgi:hypothetical protein
MSDSFRDRLSSSCAAMPKENGEECAMVRAVSNPVDRHLDLFTLSPVPHWCSGDFAVHV